MVTAVVCDNGESFLERCLQSLKNQSIETSIIVASGPKTDLAIAEKYADRVFDPVAGIGKARVQAIQAALTPYILSCDSDTVYDSRYAEYAALDLKTFNAVKAGSIRPLNISPLAWVEMATQYMFAYEFSLAFRKQAFLEAGIHERDYSNVKEDIGRAVFARLFPVPDLRMVCWTRMPTYHAELAVEYMPMALVGFAPIAVSLSVPIANELLGRLR